MALPALRQPKCIPAKLPPAENPSKPPVFAVADASSFLILTMKNGKKLVVTSDSYNGIVKAVDTYECVFCTDPIQVDNNLKESHKRTKKHLVAMDSIPFDNELSENLIRQISHEQAYCTLCHIVLNSQFLTRHLASEVHCTELEMASERANIYKPSA